MNLQEDYCSSEIVKLLREKGFKCGATYSKGFVKELMQLIDAEMNDPVLGKLLNRNAAYVLCKEIKILFIEKACEWLRTNLCEHYADEPIAHKMGRPISGYISFFEEPPVAVIGDFHKAMKGGEK